MQCNKTAPYVLTYAIFFGLLFNLLISRQLISQGNSIHFPPYPIRSFQTNGAVSGIAIEDFNGDGFDDIAVSELLTSTVSILLNQKDTEEIFFSLPITFDVGWEPTSLVCADFDGDGNTDIITANQGSEDITILRNISIGGTPNFEVSVGPKLRKRPLSLIAADFNSDGKKDLAVANTWSDTITVLKNTSFKGKIDFNIDIELWAGSLSFSEKISAHDFDGDGRIDLATLAAIEKYGSNVFIVFPNTSSGDKIEFGTPPKLKGGGSDKFTCGDFDNNSKIDLAILGSWSSIYVLQNESTPGNLSFDYDEWVGFDDGPGRSREIHSVDLNNDSLPDLVMTTPLIFFAEPKKHNYLSILINNTSIGKVQFAPFITYGVAEDPMSITSADFDKDGKIDLAISHDDSRCISILHNRSTLDTVMLNSSSIFPLEFSGGPPPKEGNDIPYPCAINGADFDGDNKVDLVAVSWDSSAMVLLRNISTPGNLNFISETTYPTKERPNSIVIGDFNNDNKPDIAVANEKDDIRENGSLSFYRNTSEKGNFSFILDSLILAYKPLSLGIGDFDQDGKSDIFIGTDEIRGSSVRSVGIILKNSSTTDNILFEKVWALELSGAVTMQSIAIADYNFDGKADVVIGCSGTYNLMIIRNESSNGILNFKYQGEVNTNFWELDCIAAGELDGDDLLDLVVAGRNDIKGGCSIFKNVSTQDSIIFSSPMTYHPLKNPSSLFICDLTGDERPDIIVGDPFSQTAILENKCTTDNISFSPAFPGAIVLGDIEGNYNYFVADFDGDGFNDIAAPRSDQLELWILRTSTDTFTSTKNSIEAAPAEFYLGQNYPNPFNPLTSIEYRLPKDSYVTLRIFNITGQLVKSLIDEKQLAGYHNMEWKR
jgi:hypothetical protein